MDEQKPVRLHVYLARCGVDSRRKCEAIIQEGRVTVDSQIVTELGTKVTGDEEILVDGAPIGGKQKKVYLALHKPPRVVTANSDPTNRPVTADLVKQYTNRRVFHVGRLDFLSSGLIFYTNDGYFSDTVIHPSNDFEKEYMVETKKAIDQKIIEAFTNGIIIEGKKYQCKNISQKTPTKAYIILTEGKNREIRNVFYHFNQKIHRLHRVRIGCVNIRDLPPGKCRKLTKSEVDWFFSNKKE
ncbi:MAG: pseudouridine synthase [Spirochaetia bacterium]